MVDIASWFRPASKTLAGVDIGTSSVKVAELRRAGKNRYSLVALGREALPPDAIVDGVIISKLAVADAIEALFKKHSIRKEKIATSICGHSVIVKKVQLPAQSEQELDESIQWEAEQYIPFDISEVNLDYQILSRPASKGGQMEVLLVAAKRDKITDHTSVLSMAGKRPLVVDIDAFALQNAFEANYEPDARSVIALLDIGSNMINVNIVRGGDFLFTRDIAMGGNHYTEFLQKELNVSFEEAEDYKAGETPTEELQAQTASILDAVSEILTLEVLKTFDFFKTTTQSVELAEVYLSGGASRTSGLRKHLQERLEIPVEYLNPFLKIGGDGKFSEEELKEMAPHFTVAVGLALRTERES